MTDDFIESTFADLDQFYPGSKRKRKPLAKKEPIEPVETNWDANPLVKTLPNGREIEMFTIGALAVAVGRPIVTIRTWIKEGYIPASPYRLPDTTNKFGQPHAGRRLWSRATVERLIELLGKAGLLNEKRIEWPEHRKLSNEIAEAWNQIRADETKTQ
jgi:hypothetical protein